MRALVALIDAHRGAFEFDWRTRFTQRLDVIGSRAMSWGEAIRLTGHLAMLPDSHVAAAIGGWDRPISSEAIVLMDLFDLQHQSKARRKPAPYPRPWPNKDSHRFGRSPYTPEATRAILDAHRTGTGARALEQRPAEHRLDQQGRRRDARGRFAAAPTT